MTPLNQLKQGDRALVVGYQRQTPHHQHLQTLGLVPGTEIQMGKSAPFGGCFQLYFRGLNVCLRSKETEYVTVRRISRR